MERFVLNFYGEKEGGLNNIAQKLILTNWTPWFLKRGGRGEAPFPADERFIKLYSDIRASFMRNLSGW